MVDEIILYHDAGRKKHQCNVNCFTYFYYYRKFWVHIKQRCQVQWPRRIRRDSVTVHLCLVCYVKFSIIYIVNTINFNKVLKYLKPFVLNVINIIKLTIITTTFFIDVLVLSKGEIIILAVKRIPWYNASLLCVIFSTHLLLQKITKDLYSVWHPQNFNSTATDYFVHAPNSRHY